MAIAVCVRIFAAPIHEAAKEDDLDSLQEELDAGVEIDARDEFDATPLHWAVVREQFSAAYWLVSRGAEINVVAIDGKTPLHLAAISGNLRIANLLIENGAEINPQDLDGMTPLNYARGNEDVARLLLDHGGEEQPVCVTQEAILAMNQGGVSPLFVLSGQDARVFLAVDPRLTGEFEDAFSSLMDQEIDQIVAMRLTGGFVSGLVAAVPFSGGCAVEGYGEPDMAEKITAMRAIVRLIDRRGIDDHRVREMIRDLWEDERPITMSDEELDDQVSLQLERVQTVLGVQR